MRIWRHQEEVFGLMFLLFLLFVTPVVLYLAQEAHEIRSRAEGISADIFVDTNQTIGFLPRPWEALAQGGEEKGRMLQSVIQEVKSLSPRYIRIDHIFDLYNVVSRDSAGFYIYDFSVLDQTVDDILSSGALPFFSLSYMPTEFSQGSIVDPPKDWEDWQGLVQRTIEHYSGRKNKNLSNVFYEVWNEPDLFGGFDQYPNLYKNAVLGASRALDVLPFKIGGPGTSVLERRNVLGRTSYVEIFLKFVKSEGLRLDFISWHLYSSSTSEFRLQAEKINLSLASFPEYLSLPKVISEWGSNSEMDVRHNTVFDAAHSVAALRFMTGRIDLAFSFEIKDGVNVDGSSFLGRWGILTHEKFGLKKKPRYYALDLLSKLRPNLVAVSGEGTFVSAIASRDETTTSVILVNYDPNSAHSEIVPITFRGLETASYSLRKTILDETNPTGSSSVLESPVFSGELVQQIAMGPNSVMLLELTKLSPLFSFDGGKFGYPGDFSLLVKDNSRPFTFPLSGNLVFPSGTIEMWVNPNWKGGDNKQYTLFEVPLTGKLLFGAYKIVSGFSNVIAFGLWNENDFPRNPIKTVSANVSSWPEGAWQHLSFSFDKDQLALAVNGVVGSDGRLNEFTDIGIGQNFYLGKRQDATFPWNGLIDELRISKIVRRPQLLMQPFLPDSETISLRHFDATVSVVGWME